MKKRKINKKIIRKVKRASFSVKESLDLHTEVEKLLRQVEEWVKFSASAEERIQDLEIHVNLLTRLLTTLCVEKFGMRVGVLKRLIKRIEKEAIRDSQIMHLESIYKLPASTPDKPKPTKPSSPDDPWDQIS